MTANPEPIIIFENTMPCDRAQPGQRPVDVQRRHAAHRPITTTPDALVQSRAMSSRSPFRRPTRRRLSTNRYTYSAQFVDIGSGVPTSDVQRRHQSAQLLEQRLRRRLDAARARADHLGTGGVILDLGDKGRTLWFTGSGQRRRLLPTRRVNSRRSQELRRHLHPHADRRHANHVQFGWLRDGHRSI